jgi:ATP-dependent Lon protease
LPDIPDEVKNTLKFHFVKNVDEVLEVALGASAKLPRPKAKAASHT